MMDDDDSTVKTRITSLPRPLTAAEIRRNELETKRKETEDKKRYTMIIRDMQIRASQLGSYLMELPVDEPCRRLFAETQFVVRTDLGEVVLLPLQYLGLGRSLSEVIRQMTPTATRILHETMKRLSEKARNG